MWILGDHIRILPITQGLRDYIPRGTTNKEKENIKHLLSILFPLSPFTPILINFTHAQSNSSERELLWVEDFAFRLCIKVYFSRPNECNIKT